MNKDLEKIMLRTLAISKACSSAGEDGMSISPTKSMGVTIVRDMANHKLSRRIRHYVRATTAAVLQKILGIRNTAEAN